MPRFKVVIVFVFIIFVLQFQGVAAAEYDPVSETVGWKIIQSEYCTIFCHPNVDLRRLNSRIRVRFYDIELGRFSPRDKTAEEQLAEKFDRILRKVEKILDMYPRKMHLKVLIYRSQDQLDNIYIQIFGFTNSEEFISYYVHKYTTIYTTEQEITEGILAHEMGHAIADHYFLILPPETVKEMLSQYVEIHLED